MSTTSGSPGDSSSPVLARQARHHTFFTLNPVARTFLAVAELVALAGTTAALVGETTTLSSVARFILLVVVSVGYAELTGRVEQIRRYIDPDSRKAWTNYTSVWAFAGVLTLPVGYAALLTATVYVHVLLHGRRTGSVRPYRLVFTAATMVLATLAAGEVLAHAPNAEPPYSSAMAAVAIGVTLIVFWLVNVVVLICGMFLSTRPTRVADLLPDRSGVAFEYVTLLLGVVTGIFVLHSVFLTPFVLVLIATTHRSSLVSDLQIAAATDLKTGLLNAAAWRDRARQSLSYAGRTGQAACVFVLDLDHFKTVNDEYGHLAGDRVLIRVAETLRTEVRGHDVVGRFGGEEFVLFVDAASEQSAMATAERLRELIAAGRSTGVRKVTASIGVAYASQARGIRLDDLLDAADRALYVAKAGGRDQINTVQVSTATIG